MDDSNKIRFREPLCYSHSTSYNFMSLIKVTGQKRNACDGYELRIPVKLWM